MSRATAVFVHCSKGHLISKCLFGVFNFFQKTNENKSTWGTIIVKSNSFVHFLEETLAWKNHFNLVWPLDDCLLPWIDFTLWLSILIKSFLYLMKWNPCFVRLLTTFVCYKYTKINKIFCWNDREYSWLFVTCTVYSAMNLIGSNKGQSWILMLWQIENLMPNWFA